MCSLWEGEEEREEEGGGGVEEGVTEERGKADEE